MLCSPLNSGSSCGRAQHGDISMAHLGNGAGAIVLDLVVSDVQLSQVLIRVLLQRRRQRCCSRIAEAITPQINHNLPLPAHTACPRHPARHHGCST